MFLKKFDMERPAAVQEKSYLIVMLYSCYIYI